MDVGNLQYKELKVILFNKIIRNSFQYKKLKTLMDVGTI